MKFKEFLLEEENIKDWESYVKRIPMLKAAIQVMKILKKYGDIYIVGGAVRDIISGEKEPDDIDLATNVPMKIIEDKFLTFDIGKNKEFGIIVIKYKGFDFEIAQFRSDSYENDLKGKGATSVKIVQNFKGDASRRDFTINALAVDEKGTIIDHFSGHKAIKNKLIQAVGDPKKRFEEDSIRMLRAVRFSSRLGFDIEDKTSQAIKSLSKNIKKVAPERIMKEFLKMAEQEGTKFADAIIKLDEVGLLKEIFPEIVKMKEFNHDIENHPEGVYVRKILK
jgi:tRNA nucleotidyltransferase/poly(A) polymerase